MDVIFKALSDETRRSLLDMLHKRDGQTLTELEEQLGMTRFGVMKHLKVLEEASLVITRRSGRFKYHYLNAVPLQQVIDRWIEPLTQKPMARAALDLKAKLEGTEPMNAITMEETKPDFVLETYIKTSVDRLWQALTDEHESSVYHFFKARTVSTFEVGAPILHVLEDGTEMIKGSILAIDPPKRLEMTFEPDWMPDAPASRVAYEIEDKGNACKLTILHYEIPPGLEGVRSGWSEIAASLKSYLETGEPLLIPNSGYRSAQS